MILIDYRMLNMDGIIFIKEVNVVWINFFIVILIVVNDVSLVFVVLDVGVVDFIIKDVESNYLDIIVLILICVLGKFEL